MIQKLKDAWQRHWDEYKSDCIEKGLRKREGVLVPNPGKTFYLKLVAKVVREVKLGTGMVLIMPVRQ